MKVYNSISTKIFTTYVFLILVIKTTIITINVSAQSFSCTPASPPAASTNKDARIVGIIPNIIPNPNYQPPAVTNINWAIYTDIIYETTSLLPNTITTPSTSGGPPISPSKYADDDYLNNLTLSAKEKDVKIFVAIGNYGANTIDIWNNRFSIPALSIQYAKSIANYVNTHPIAGINIEYPNPKCGAKLPNTKVFTDTIKSIKDNLFEDKLITLTVGPTDPPSIAMDLNGTVQWVNVIGYRLNIGLIDNKKDNKDGPTSPLDNAPAPAVQFLTFKDMATRWKDFPKIVMGVEFSGIIRKAKNTIDELKKSQLINLVNEGALDSLLGKSKQMYNCDDPNPNKYEYMHSIPWVDLKPPNSVLTDNCTAAANWERVFDNATSSTFLYNNVAEDGDNLYISYEDTQSLQYKVNFIKQQKLGGIMISDISADPNNDLLSIVSSIRGSQGPPSTPTTSTGESSTPNTAPPGPSPSTSSDASSNSTSDSTNKPIGIIVGSVFASLIAIAIVAIGFLYYRHRKRGGQMSLNKSVNSNNYQNMSVPVSIIDKAVPATPASRVTALYDFEGKEDTDLSFKKGDVIEIIERGDGANDWWVGKVGSKIGEFPGNYVRE